MNTMQLKIIGISAAALLIATTTYIIISQGPQIGLQVENPIYTVSNFASYDDLNTFLQSSVDTQNTESLFNGMETSLAPRPESSNEANQEDKTISDAGYDSSDSSVQLPGVDEPDMVKTDGTYLYVIAQGKLHIISAYPAEDAFLCSTITFEESSTPRNLFINGNTLAVIMQSYLYRTFEGTEPSDDDAEIWQDTTSTHIELYDVSDKQDPVKIRDISLDGYYYTANMIDDYVYVITTQYSYEPVLYKGAESSYVPSICVDEHVEPIDLSRIYYVNDPGISKTLTHIVSVNVNDVNEEVHAEVFLVGDPSAIYVSAENVYIACSSYLYDYTTVYGLLEEYVLPALPAEATNELNAVDSLTLDDYQKTMVVGWIIQNYVNDMNDQQKQTIAEQLIVEIQKTILHKITINNGDISYAYQGTLPGMINNQDALSEYNGYLRVVTTVNGWVMSSYLCSIDSFSNVYVLDETLTTIGTLEHLAEGKDISSIRFIGDTCYLDTYEQTEPLLVIDLSNTAKPEVVGELSISGYSTYLYPYDDTHIIGIGQEDNTMVVYLIDVQDMSQPRERSKYQIQSQTKEDYWLYSRALYDHQAFFLDQENHLLILPVSGDYTESAYVFDVSEGEIGLRGILSHTSDELETEPQEPWDSPTWKGGYSYSIQRSFCINDVIYTISDAMIKMHDRVTLDEINSISLL
jgi:inhibitor of cysteine peptidase